MNFSTIQQRSSCRSFSGRPLESGDREKLTGFLAKHRQGPFGHRVSFTLLDMDGRKNEEIKRLTTYGVIKNAPHYIGGTVAEKPGALEDFGYAMEKAVLYATALGLGTCWIGGTFKRSSLAVELEPGPDEIIPAMSPVGYPADRRRLLDKVMRLGAGSDSRKPWETLFYYRDLQEPLYSPNAGTMARALEAVRLAPSASNKQPWRVLMDEDHRTFHFYLKRNKQYEKAVGALSLQNIDMGIAMYHFECAAEELGSKGEWLTCEPGIDSGSLEYIVTWKTN